MALDRARLESIGKAVPGARQAWHVILRFRRARWWKRWVLRDPAEVVQSNSKKAFDYFYDQDEFVETQYLSQARLDFLAYVADYCSSVATRIDGGANPLRVIDVGCGTGHLLLALINRLPEPVRLCGLDFSDSAIRRSRRLVPSVELVVANVYEIPYPDHNFDLVTCTETLEHLERPKEALQEMFRILKPGGHLVVTVPDGTKDDWSGHVNFWSAEELRRILLPYEVRQVTPTPPDGDLLAHATKPRGSQQLVAGPEIGQDVPHHP
jgi:SAM-dependent methyltransferase